MKQNEELSEKIRLLETENAKIKEQETLLNEKEDTIKSLEE